MISTFKAFVRNDCGLSLDSSILVGVSGGADSMLLLNLLQQLGFSLTVAHCNFGLRSDESDGDELFVRDYCSQNDIPFYSKRFKVKKENGSIQIQARDLRYDWFEDLRQKLQLDFIAVGSHLDDKLETALINFMRGTGPSGIRNMKARNGFIVRPLLWASKDLILKETSKRNLSYRNDSSNEKNDYKRNALRNKVIPTLKELKPSLLKSYEQSSKVMEAYEKVYDKSLEDYLNTHLNASRSTSSISKASLFSYISPLAVLHKWLSSFGFSFSQFEDILALENETESKLFQSSTHKLSIDREGLYLSLNTESERFSQEIERLPFSSDEKGIEMKEVPIPSELKNSEVLFLDLEKVHFPLQIRTWKEGDKMRFFGMGGRKKLSDYFTDQKLGSHEKRGAIVISDRKGICCIPGYAISEDYKIESSSQRCLAVKLDQAAF